MLQPPKILSRTVIARSRLFAIEALNLRFSNGNRATFERLMSAGDGIVMVAAVTADSLIMLREYAAGVNRRELGLVKGRIDPGESPAQAAQRELREEAHYGAQTLTLLRRVDNAPAYTNFATHLFLATGLFPAALPGDETEPPERVEWPLAELPQLQRHREVNDPRVLLALLLLERRMARGAL